MGLSVFGQIIDSVNYVSTNIDSLNLNSIYVKSYIDNNVETYDVHYSILSYQSFADVLLLPSEKPRMNETYEVEIFDNAFSNTIRNEVIGNDEVIQISNLIKDREYTINIYRINIDESRTLVNSNLNIINTSPESEFRVSNTFYQAISQWSSHENQTKKLIDFLKDNTNTLNPYEVAAFIQYHYKTGDIFNNLAGNISDFINNPPLLTDTSSVNINERDNRCNCSLILNTYRYPNTPSASYSSSPEDTNYVAVGNGAAKTMLLSMVGKHSSGEYEANIGGALSPLYAIISYNLVCYDYYTDIPEECMCPKKILYDYSYTARLTTKAKNGGGFWIWSSGAEAAAEDYALLTIRNGSDVTAADAGKIRISSNCNASWTTGWWTEAVNTLVSAAGVIINTSVTIVSWANLLPQVVTLLSTNFFNKSGDCTDKHEINTLMAGNGEVMMTTNKPVEILISSLGYEYVRGFGKWESRSTIVSDYHLAVVLLGQDKIRPECCTPNVANFLIGNFEDQFVTIKHPLNQQLIKTIKVFDGSVNSDGNLKGKVNRLLTLWGPWPGLDRDTYGNYILNGDVGHFIRNFPDCAPVDPILDDEPELRSKVMYSNDLEIFPNPGSDQIQINYNKLAQLSLVNMQGQVLVEHKLNSDKGHITLDVSGLLSWSYIIIATDESGQTWISKFQKL